MLRSILANPAAVYGVAIKAVQGFASLASAIFVVRYFSPEVQGYYYTFANILALQIFLELGLSAVVNTFAAHEWARLSLGAGGAVEGDARSLSRLGSLARLVAKWYMSGAALLFVLLAGAGTWFFGTHDAAHAVAWRLPWLVMCLVAALSFVLTPAWALLTGCGQLANLNAFRLLEVVLRSAALWACMAAGGDLWSTVVALTVSTAASVAFLLARYRRFFASLLCAHHGNGIHWAKELAPLQLRIAVSWMCGYFIFSLFVPVTFHFHGPAEAGRMGMTWALVAGTSGIAGTWLQVQAPNYAMMVARKDFAALDATALRTTAVGFLIFVGECAVALGALLFLEQQYPEVAARFISSRALAVFLAAECMLQLSLAQATYLRAFKQEPFLPLSLAGALIIGAGTVLLTPSLGAYGPALSYLAGMAVGLVWGTFIFFRLRRQWTAPAQT